MLREIQTANNSINRQFQNLEKNIALSPHSLVNNVTHERDKFNRQSDKQKNKRKFTLFAITGTSIVLLIGARAKLGNVLKLAGEKVPLTFIGRLIKISDIALKDGLTDLFNKRNLLSTLYKECKKAIRHKKNYSVAMLDMDNFKLFNEEFGHDTGDKVLKRVAVNIHQIAKKYKVKSFRYGGEEFVVTLFGHDAESAKKIIKEIAEKIKNDEVIQSLVPDFREKSRINMGFMTPKLSKLNSIFGKLRRGIVIGSYKKFGKEIVSLLEDHINKYEPADTKILRELIDKINGANWFERRKILRIHTKLSDGSTLGNELDKIYAQYRGIKNDLQKWTDHVDKNKMFTISGGVVDLNDTNGIEDGSILLKIADTALKSAKENGKNVIIKANDVLIKKVMEKINKEKTA